MLNLLVRDRIIGAMRCQMLRLKCNNSISAYLHLFRMFKLQYCTKFGQLVLRKIIKIVATRSHILRLKCTKIDFGWGSAPDPAGGAYSVLVLPLSYSATLANSWI